MKFQDFVNIFGEVVVGLQDAIVQRAHARFLFNLCKIRMMMMFMSQRDASSSYQKNTM